MDVGKELVQFDQRHQRAKWVLVRVYGKYFEVVSDDTMTVKYRGYVDGDMWYCQCPNYEYNQYPEYTYKHGHPYECKHIIKAKKVMEMESV